MVVQKLRKFELAVKKRRNSIYIIYEGYREGYFLEHLEKHSEVKLNSIHCNGGNANSIVINGIKHSARDISVYVLFDEDFELKPDYKISDETLEGLAKAWKLGNDNLIGCPYKDLQAKNSYMKSPMLIVSNPLSLEGILLRLLDCPQGSLEGKTTKQLKQMIDGIVGNVQLNNDDNLLIKSYDKKINKYKEEITKLRHEEPNYQERCRFFESRIDDSERNKKNRVTFMRFLSEKLPLPVITARRNEIPEIEILLKAFGL